MIRVRLEPHRLRVQGHAGTAPKGEDLVCAACSALVYATAQRLNELEKPTGQLLEGDVDLRWTGDRSETLAVLRAGVKLLERDYPQAIHFEEG